MGQGPLNLGVLTWLALSSALHNTLEFASVLTFVLKLMADAQIPLPEPKPVAKKKKTSRPRKGAKRGTKRSKHDPHGSSDDVSEEAFTQARRKMPAGFWIALILLLGKAFEKEHADLTLYHGLRLLALDGTSINLPMWSKLKNHFGTARNGKGPRTVQARMVMLQLPLVRLPRR
jgi:hypothetical protein